MESNCELFVKLKKKKEKKTDVLCLNHGLSGLSQYEVFCENSLVLIYEMLFFYTKS